MIIIIPILFFVISFTAFGKEFYIEKIEFQGCENKQLKEIKHYLKDQTKIQDIIKTLSNQTKFDKIKFIIKNKKLTVNVVEKPIIKNIDIHGDSATAVKLLLEKNMMIPGQKLDIVKLNFFKKQLKFVCKNAGIVHSNLIIKLYLNKKTNAVNIKVNFIQNGPIKIKDIFINGNNYYSTKRVKSILEFEKMSWLEQMLTDYSYYERFFDENMMILKMFYLNHGFLDFNIRSVKFFFDKNKKNTYILLDVHEGDKYKVGHITLKFKKKCDPKFGINLQNFISSQIKQYDTYSAEIESTLQNELTTYFHNNGFLKTKITHQATYIGKGLVNITYNCKNTTRSKIKDFKIKKNNIVSTRTLKKLVKQMEYNVGSKKNFDKIIEDFVKHALIKSAIIKFEEPKKTKKFANVIIEFEELKSSKLTAGLSYSKEFGLGINLASDMLNFLDLGYNLNTKLHKDNFALDKN
jgi:outer membrane protein insertion porin family